MNNYLTQKITNPILDSSIKNQSGEEYAAGLLPRLVTFGIIIGSVLFVFYLIFGGTRWITSGGDPKKLESARSTITNALIGLIVLFSVFAIAIVIENAFGIKILTIDLSAITIRAPAPGGIWNQMVP